LARDALERRQGFEIVESFGIPALWERFVPRLSEEDAKAICKTYYLDLISDVNGHSSLVRRDSIRLMRDSLLSKVEGPSFSRAVAGDPNFRSGCVQSAKSIQRELLPSQGWVRAKGGGFGLGIARDTLSMTFDYGTYRTWAEVDLKVANIGLRLAPSVLFCVDLNRYLAYTSVEVFAKRFANVMELVIFFGDRLREVSAPVGSGVTLHTR
jgi:hypothetical protein